MEKYKLIYFVVALLTISAVIQYKLNVSVPYPDKKSLNDRLAFIRHFNNQNLRKIKINYQKVILKTTSTHETVITSKEQMKLLIAFGDSLSQNLQLLIDHITDSERSYRYAFRVNELIQHMNTKIHQSKNGIIFQELAFSEKDKHIREFEATLFESKVIESLHKLLEEENRKLVFDI